MLKNISFFIMCLFILLTTNPVLASDNQIAIIIDDFGGDVKGVDQFLEANIPITVAIMPFQKYATEQAELAHKAGLEVIIHMPMEPKKGKASWLGPNAITTDLSDEQIKERVHQAIENVPHAVGMNNHMGSKIVENEHIMRIVMEIANEHQLYFLDSGTSEKSVIPALAKELNMPFIARDIFIDDSLSSQREVELQIDKLMKLSKSKGKAVGIGHVGIKGNETFSAVENGWKKMKQNQLRLVYLSELLEAPITHQLHHIQYEGGSTP
ncbi:divergent polysaccharide deacetylase family protein [Alkalihalobacillus sp. 1P02AB]|uniref:divergent polysaccharide deacetylase family protein n=1 Tax=Alkalihalobacillus sp. 1P02AB TaxID=3132260 RepID=UPI0039A77595